MLLNVYVSRKLFVSDRLNVLQHLKIFVTYVQPSLLYCGELIGIDVLIRDNTDTEKRYSLYLPGNIVIKFCKLILGVNRSAVNSPVLA